MTQLPIAIILFIVIVAYVCAHWWRAGQHRPKHRA